MRRPVHNLEGEFLRAAVNSRVHLQHHYPSAENPGGAELQEGGAETPWKAVKLLSGFIVAALPGFSFGLFS